MEIFICKIFFCPYPQNRLKMHMRNYLWSLIKNCPYPENSGVWKLNYTGFYLCPEKNSPFPSCIRWYLDSWRLIIFQNLKTWVKCILEIMYHQFFKTAFTHWIPVFEFLTILTIDEVFDPPPPLSSFISENINLYRFIFVQNLRPWVKFTWSMIYYQFSKTA